MTAELIAGSLDPAPDSLTARLAPEVAAMLAAEHDELATLAGEHLFGRFVFDRAWPIVLKLAPVVVARTVEAIRARYGARSMTLNQVLDLIAKQI